MSCRVLLSGDKKLYQICTFFLLKIIFSPVLSASWTSGLTKPTAVYNSPKTVPIFDDFTPAVVDALQGQTLLLPCTVRNVGDRVVSWIRSKDLHILTSGQVTFSSDSRFESVHSPKDDFWGLRIRGVYLSDTGRYECQVNTDPKMSMAINLHVSKGVPTWENPESNWLWQALIKGPSEVYVQDGSQAIFTCEISPSAPSTSSIFTNKYLMSEDGKPRVQWFHNNDEISFSPEAEISSEIFYTEIGVISKLKLLKVTSKDSGQYVCAGPFIKASSLRLSVTEARIQYHQMYPSSKAEIEIKRKRPKRRAKHSLRAKLLDHVIFCLNVASMHGLIHLIRPERHLVEKLIWFILVISAFTVATIQAIEVWHRYQTRPVVTSLEQDYLNWNTTFASVTICQLTPKGIPQIIKDYAEMHVGRNITNDDITDYIKDLMFTTYETYDQLEKYANGSKVDILPTNLYLEFIKNWTHLLEMKTGKRVKIEKNTPALGIMQPFYSTFTEQGLCSTYNNEIAVYFTLENFNKSKVINEYKLVEFGVDEGRVPCHFKSLITEYKAFLESPNEIIDITSGSQLIPASTTSTIEFYTTSVLANDELRSLSVAQKDCRFTHEAENLKHSPVYSYKLCKMECRIEMALKYCNCTPHYYRRLDGEPICNLAGLYCLSKYKNIIITLMDPKTMTTICPCEQNCNYHNVYLTKQESGPWFLETMLDIVYNDFPSVRYRRSLIFSRSDLLVQIGGLFGLFLGCSILSFIEIPYFLTLRLYWGVFGNKQIKP